MRDLQESLWKLSNIHEANLKVLSEIWVLILRHKPIDHELDNPWLSILINLIDNLFLAVKMDRATHDNQTCIQRVFIDLRVALIEELATSLNDHMVNALLLALVVDAHVPEHPKGQLANHLEVIVG